MPGRGSLRRFRSRLKHVAPGEPTRHDERMRSIAFTTSTRSVDRAMVGVRAAATLREADNATWYVKWE